MRSGIVMSAVAVTTLCGAAVWAQNGSSDYEIPEDTPESVRDAVESGNRPAEDRARDVSRKPAHILAMAGVEPGDHVIEIAGFGQYYTRLLAQIVGPLGQVDVYDLPYTEEFAGDVSREFAGMFTNVSYHQNRYGDVEFPSGVDVVFNVLYYHDLRPNEVDTAAFNEKIYEALRPGGRYVIVDHKAAAGAGWSEAESLHRIEPSTIVEEVTAAGFELAIDSDVLANPDDDRSESVFAEGMRGQTARAVFVFQKPA